MKKRNIVLIGFMGSGKSLVSKMLAQLLGIEAVSTDEIIEKREGQPIHKIFAEKGEDYFRALERDVVKDISQKEGVIIDCGGGVVLNPENMRDLKQFGIIIYLSASAEFLYEQVKNANNRPLLNVDDPLARIKDLLNERANLYGQADYTVVSEGKSIQEVAQDVIKVLSNE